MDRKEFWKNYKKDPAATWRRLADETQDPEVSMLYQSFERAERERLAPTDETSYTEGTELNLANELNTLSRNGPSILERTLWFLAGVWGSTFQTTFRLSGRGLLRAKKLALIISDKIDDLGNFWVALFGIVVWFNVFGFEPSAVVLGLMIGYLLVIESTKGYQAHKAISNVMFVVWLGMAVVTSTWATVTSSRAFDSQPLPEEEMGFLIRDGRVVWAKTFESGVWFDWHIMPARRLAYGDNFDWHTNNYANFSHTYAVYDHTLSEDEDIKRQYTVSFRYLLRLKPVPPSHPINGDIIKQEVEFFENLIRIRVETATSLNLDQPPTMREVMSMILEPADGPFLTVIRDFEIKETGFQVLISGKWHQATPLPTG